MRSLFLLLLMLPLWGSSFSQPLDSVQRHLDSINRSVQSMEDSLYRLRMMRNMAERGQTIDQFLADFEERQEKERKRNYIRIGVGALFMAALIYGLLRKRRLQRKP